MQKWNSVPLNGCSLNSNYQLSSLLDTEPSKRRTRQSHLFSKSLSLGIETAHMQEPGKILTWSANLRAAAEGSQVLREQSVSWVVRKKPGAPLSYVCGCGGTRIPGPLSESNKAWRSYTPVLVIIQEIPKPGLRRTTRPTGPFTRSTQFLFSDLCF